MFKKKTDSKPKKKEKKRKRWLKKQLILCVHSLCFSKCTLFFLSLTEQEEVDECQIK